MIKYVCQICNKEFFDHKKRRRKVCSKKCKNISIGKKNKFNTKRLWQNSEYRKHMSEVHKGYKPTIEQKRKIGLKSKQWRATEETKKKMSSVKMGSKNPMYGKYKKVRNSFYKNGYVYIHKPNHPFCDKGGFVREHRYIMEQHIKRYLLPQERVHHINGIKDDNRIENLKLFLNESKHQKSHKPKGSMIGRNKIIHT